MKKSIFILLFIFSFCSNAFSVSSPVSYKAKFVMKDKTSFVAYFYSWDGDFDNEKTYEKTCTDKGFQQYLNRMNYSFMYNDNNELIKKYEGITLYKNSYKMKVSNPEATNNFPFGTKNDEIKIDANDILYTVYLGEAPAGQPTIFDDASVNDMKTNKITATYSDAFEICNYYFYTTNKGLNSKKIQALLKQKKVSPEKLSGMEEYYQKIKTELAKLKIYLFQECIC